MLLFYTSFSVSTAGFVYISSKASFLNLLSQKKCQNIGAGKEAEIVSDFTKESGCAYWKQLSQKYSQNRRLITVLKSWLDKVPGSL